MNRWDREQTLVLIENYKKHELLYKIKHPYHFKIPKKNAALAKIVTAMKDIKPNVTIGEVKSKIKILNQQMAQEKKKMMRAMSTVDVYKSSLWCYNELRFLLNANDEVHGHSSIVDDNEMNAYSSDNDASLKEQNQTNQEDDFLELRQSSNNRTFEEKMLERREDDGRDEIFCKMLCSELKQLKLEETYDNATAELLSTVRKWKREERQKLEKQSYVHQRPVSRVSSTTSTTESYYEHIKIEIAPMDVAQSSSTVEFDPYHQEISSPDEIHQPECVSTQSEELSNEPNLESEALMLKKKNEKRRRRYWVMPWRESRDLGGNIQNLLKEYNLYDDSKSYESFLHMDEECFVEILNFVKENIKRSDTSMRKCVPVEEKLAATLRFLATGETFKKIADNRKLSLSYIGSSIIEVCSAIYRNMQPKYLQFPDSKEKWLEVAEAFEEHWQFPMCLGALDGKHIAFKAHKESADLFCNNKGYASIVLLALADAHGKFLFIDVGCNGRTSDGDVLDRSDLKSILEKDELFPPAKIIGNNRVLPYVMVADNAFPIGKRLITPYSKNLCGRENIVFNNRLNRARQCIEGAFGIMSNRFRVLQTQIQLNEEKAATIVQACCTLHNFLIDKSFSYRQIVKIEYEELNEDTENFAKNLSNNRGEQIRNAFAEYFSYEGKL